MLRKCTAIPRVAKCVDGAVLFVYYTQAHSQFDMFKENPKQPATATRKLSTQYHIHPPITFTLSGFMLAAWKTPPRKKHTPLVHVAATWPKLINVPNIVQNALNNRYMPLPSLPQRPNFHYYTHTNARTLRHLPIHPSWERICSSSRPTTKKKVKDKTPDSMTHTYRSPFFSFTTLRIVFANNQRLFVGGPVPPLVFASDEFSFCFFLGTNLLPLFASHCLPIWFGTSSFIER